MATYLLLLVIAVLIYALDLAIKDEKTMREYVKTSDAITEVDNRIAVYTQDRMREWETLCKTLERDLARKEHRKPRTIQRLKETL